MSITMALEIQVGATLESIASTLSSLGRAAVWAILDWTQISRVQVVSFRFVVWSSLRGSWLKDAP